jgi:putative transposase
LRFLKKAVRHQGLPEKITIDQSGVNTAAIEALIEETGQEIEIRQDTYLNNLVEQDHRAAKRIVRAMLGFMSFRAASITLRGSANSRLCAAEINATEPLGASGR